MSKGIIVHCTNCDQAAFLRYTDKTKASVSNEGLDGWYCPPLCCPNCLSTETDRLGQPENLVVK